MQPSAPPPGAPYQPMPAQGAPVHTGTPGTYMVTGGYTYVTPAQAAAYQQQQQQQPQMGYPVQQRPPPVTAPFGIAPAGSSLSNFLTSVFRGVEDVGNSVVHSVNNAVNSVQTPSVAPGVYYGTCLPQQPCPLCGAKGGLGTFGPCPANDIHFKQVCPCCMGRTVTAKTSICPRCQGKGGFGTFGPDHPYSMHFKVACTTCQGAGFLEPPRAAAMRQCSACQGKGGLSSFRGGALPGSMQYQGACGACGGRGYLGC